MPELDGFQVAEKIKGDAELRDSVIIMLTSAGKRGDALRCRELGIKAYLSKPIKRSDLLDAIRIAMGPTAQGQAAQPALITQHSLVENRRRLRILVAEDNHVNQKLAQRLLEKRGYSVAMANTGKEALEASEREPFDLILMDVQMPVMDGLQATAQIRQRESKLQTHVPIIAMTAHAMVGDRERCLSSGMDGYVSKPLHPKELFSAIELTLTNLRRS